MLQKLHEMYPQAQLGAVDTDRRVLDTIREHYVETGLLPKNTSLMQFHPEGYADPKLIAKFGRSDLIVNIAPSPALIKAAGGITKHEQARRYVQSLLDLTEPGGAVYVAVDSSTLYNFFPWGEGYKQALEEAFQSLAGTKPVYHKGGTLAQSRFFDFEGVHSGWIEETMGLEWVEYMAIRR